MMPPDKPSDQDQIQARRRRRAEFIRALYLRVNADVNEFIDGLELGAAVGVDADETRRIIAYFEEKGAVRVDDHKSALIRLTAAGVDLVEAEIP
jgi:predicted transcriptional regulator